MLNQMDELLNLPCIEEIYDLNLENLEAIKNSVEMNFKLNNYKQDFIN